MTIDMIVPASLSAITQRIQTLIDSTERSMEEIAELLFRVQDEKLYKETHSSFDAYCQENFGHKRAWGYELIERYRVMVASNSPALPSGHAIRSERRVVTDDEPARQLGYSKDQQAAKPTHGIDRTMPRETYVRAERQDQGSIDVSQDIEDRVYDEPGASSAPDIRDMAAKLEAVLADLPAEQRTVEAVYLRDLFAAWIDA